MSKTLKYFLGRKINKKNKKKKKTRFANDLEDDEYQVIHLLFTKLYCQFTRKARGAANLSIKLKGV
jgi:hypothetical protein